MYIYIYIRSPIHAEGSLNLHIVLHRNLIHALIIIYAYAVWSVAIIARAPLQGDAASKTIAPWP